MRFPARKFLCIVSLLWWTAASAQLVPQVQVPGVPLPDVDLPNLPTDPMVRGLGDNLRALPSRATRANALLARHRAELDRDPRGELIVRAEVVALDITEAALARARAADFVVRRTQTLPELAVTITVLQTPTGMSATRGLKRLRKLDPEGTYDYNHVYLDSGTVEEAAVPAGTASNAPAHGGDAAWRVGLIDTGVDSGHVALRGSRLHRFGCAGEEIPSAHGTAVASLLVGSAENFSGSAPRAELYAADVYCDAPTGGAVDAVAAAFGWMARQNVPVVNVSLVGPRNALLERAVRVLLERGHLVVAAMGNDGPAAPPLYPAAFPRVVAVTAVDTKHRVLLEACRGKHVRLAALGTDAVAASAGTVDQYVPVRGTSFAAPVVAGLLARELREPGEMRATAALAALVATAIDLGKRDFDEVYGYGLVQPLPNLN